MSDPTKTNQIDHDGLWKRMLTEMFERFVAFAHPALYALIDFSEEVVFVEQEFQEITTTDGKQGKIYTDKVARVIRFDGKEQYIFIHVEIQSSSGGDLPSRMYRYFYRIRDRYGHEHDVAAIAVYAHDDEPKVYDRHSYNFMGTELSYKFNARVIKDYPKGELLASDNPFALVVLAAQYLNETSSDSKKRLSFKKKLVDLLIERGYSTTEGAHLLTFIKFILKLPKNLELQFDDFIKKENDNRMQVTEYMLEYTEKLNKDIHGNSMEEMKKAVAQREAKVQEIEAKAQESEAKAQESEAKLKEIVFKFYKKGMSIEEIAKFVDLPLERVREIVENRSL